MKGQCKGHVYDLKGCIRCAARLVKSARPSRLRQEAFLDYLSAWHRKEDVLAELARSVK